MYLGTSVQPNKIIIILGNNYHRKDPNAISAAQCESTDKDKMVQLKMKHNKQCMFCKHKEIDETKYGPLYKLNDVVVHYFCIVSVL